MRKTIILVVLTFISLAGICQADTSAKKLDAPALINADTTKKKAEAPKALTKEQAASLARQQKNPLLTLTLDWETWSQVFEIIRGSDAMTGAELAKLVKGMREQLKPARK